MFEYFKQAKRFEIQALERLGQDRLPPPRPPEERPVFSLALKNKSAQNGLAVIAEYKRASPSQGDIALKVSPAEAATAYADAGAAAISVLTEKSKFKGRLSFIDSVWAGLTGAAQRSSGFIPPILRKDFIFHPLQIRATAATRASALLLIVKLCPSAGGLASLINQAVSYGLECVVEVLDEGDLKLARQAGAEIIQVNARDFSDLSVDLSRSLTMAEKHLKNDDELWIAASGLEKPEDLAQVRQAGYQAALIGTALMRRGRPGESLAGLTDGLIQGRTT